MCIDAYLLLVYVSVYQMDYKAQMMEESALSKDDIGLQDGNTKSIDTCFVEMEVDRNSGVVGNTTNIQEAFIFCLMFNPCKFEEMLEQGIC